ncbi:hypothetical protein M0208_05570 [Sphingomonas sp. SUN019]|uniref:hypothetical protein n=1 Tax=Sphingomonas sp. SUN019 TaxID=2937788 RepID=UPI0021642DE4|nr:hypothetical protein [Sphingomonas sp. SUN019]UVO50012.1 hypothetical protein M0208_05570 [Sphingomonas sp. SUN019]
MMTGWTAMAIAAAATAPVDKETRSAILDRAREPVAAALGKPVLFRVRKLGLSGDWAFLHADMEERDGVPIDYTGTPRADDAAHGVVSRTYAALLHRSGTEWRVVAHAIGPTDVAWADWSTRYGAPPAIFG